MRRNEDDEEMHEIKEDREDDNEGEINTNDAEHREEYKVIERKTKAEETATVGAEMKEATKEEGKATIDSFLSLSMDAAIVHRDDAMIDDGDKKNDDEEVRSSKRKQGVQGREKEKGHR